MKRKHCTEAQIIGIPHEHIAGWSATAVIRKHGIANGIFNRWKSKYSADSPIKAVGRTVSMVRIPDAARAAAD